jgi:uncharacterized glyoxalase superfamily metalloenzyme YdcJ
MPRHWYRPAQLRAAFASSLSRLYASEVPLYSLLVRTTEEVNADALADDRGREGTDVSRLSAERHGAIRLGTLDELRQAATIFAALGMEAVGFYDLRGGSGGGIPVVATAFRPIDPAELSYNPFRMFTSLLAVQDRRYFDDSLARRLDRFLGGRRLFPPRLLELASRAESHGGLDEAAAEDFIRLATDSFRLSREPVDAGWYAELEAVSSVAADIGGVPRTHINHLTPRVLDIDLLYARMVEQGVAMIEEIQGPPAAKGADVLLRQTSFRALAEPRRFRDAQGCVHDGELRVRFGEVEARGVALTEAGVRRYEAAVAAADALSAADPSITASAALAQVWRTYFPATARDLFLQGLAPFTLRPVSDRPPDGTRPTADLVQLLDDGFVAADAVIYEDFLPRSAAGIFASNLTTATDLDAAEEGWQLDRTWLAESLQRHVHEPIRLYDQAQQASVASTLDALSVPPPPPPATPTTILGAKR